MITSDMISAMQGVIPSHLATCSKDGIPNVTYVSQIFYVDERHVALSFQFFNKTIRNVRENPNATIRMFSDINYDSWDLHVRYDHTETEGALFDNMEMQLEVIASLTGMSDVFVLQGADVYEVVSARKNTHEKR